MTQFLLFIGQGSYILYNQCSFPRIPAAMLVFQCVVFFALFANFYVQTCVRGKGKKRGGEKVAAPGAGVAGESKKDN